jgi:hypothetical protein
MYILIATNNKYCRRPELLDVTDNEDNIEYIISSHYNHKRTVVKTTLMCTHNIKHLHSEYLVMIKYEDGTFNNINITVFEYELND